MGKVANKWKRGDLVDACDRLFRRLQKLLWADGKEYVQCFTCGKWVDHKSIEVGHYHSRRFMAIRWDERNVRPQCHKCNLDMEGQSGAGQAKIVKAFYTARLTEEIGEDGMAELDAHKLDKVPTPTLDELAAVMRARLRRMEGKA